MVDEDRGTMRALAPRTGTGEGYATEMGELWSGLARTLSRLDRIAAEPERLDETDEVDALRRLQYGLHAASEHAYGLVPPTGAETAHAELRAALAGARDATAEVVEAVDAAGPEAAALLVHEWRGALFRVRLARLRLAGPRRVVVRPPAAEPRELAAPLVAFLLALGGAVTFVLGATIGPWPLWVAGMLAVCGSALAYRP
jgi:hypothetical protein